MEQGFFYSNITTGTLNKQIFRRISSPRLLSLIINKLATMHGCSSLRPLISHDTHTPTRRYFIQLGFELAHRGRVYCFKLDCISLVSMYPVKALDRKSVV